MRVSKVRVPTVRITLLNEKKNLSVCFIILSRHKIRVLMLLIEFLETDLEGNNI